MDLAAFQIKHNSNTRKDGLQRSYSFGGESGYPGSIVLFYFFCVHTIIIIFTEDNGQYSSLLS